ncbi:hypothetical protein SASPL_138262 [Salvia splendens]|uniref:Uncharacterized protein n=1 Tax=Salvia splendens TaxID=180675 RepID=A0A8X8WUV7_SALSN|nr:protein SHI RELATED SEQUENCE 1-like [Salvia splendens]KAG6401406.1 hypothetical protein SASPL_138262 [Salvia splendens]
MIRGGEATESSRSRCQDCGNQAKKDCEHSRCRSCCKNRGFQCETHVKSTWIPVAKRRPRHLAMHPHHQIPPLLHQQLALASNPKRYREIPQLGFEEVGLPAEACFPAVFRCVRVSSVDDNAVGHQYAYQTSVSIGGHVFTGILYDQGAEPQGTGNYVTGENSSSAAAALSDHPNSVARTTGTTSPSFAAPFSAFTNTTPHFLHYPKS